MMKNDMHDFEENDEENLAPVGVQGTFRNQTKRYESYREEYLSSSFPSGKRRNSGNENNTNDDGEVTKGTSRLLEVAIDSSSTYDGGKRGLGESGDDSLQSSSSLLPRWRC